MPQEGNALISGRILPFHICNIRNTLLCIYVVILQSMKTVTALSFIIHKL